MEGCKKKETMGGGGKEKKKHLIAENPLELCSSCSRVIALSSAQLREASFPAMQDFFFGVSKFPKIRIPCLDALLWTLNHPGD